MSIFEKLSEIQNELNVPKSQFNSFGNFNYRSCEDILEAVKPICAKHKTVLTLEDLLVFIGNRYYVQATARLRDLEDGTCTEATAYAREEETKKGMDGSQVTGASSSYARKYALSGLLCIDDAKDSDFTNGIAQQNAPQAKKAPAPKAAYPAKPKETSSAPAGEFTPTCKECNTPISEKVLDYSVKKFNVPLCMDCQKKYANR